ncbi:30S ribosomal protein S6 [Minwuia thermotolerans]|uniref:Small ribosomal subunit protein bS6 n=1 Tax=Minwuia thermotolerans TaxID=2056226 RepID=A0A2M9G507_9PROT|nr:30S ribosomal protein S6 [Minwuia thermotolerans]PJK30791.1 30S ribosomal protein S6 [Minwuia thermotolerans]
MAYYETVYIARPDISAQQVEQMNEEFNTLVQEQGGEIKKTEYWGLKSLAYKIKKNRKGHYVLFNLDAPAAALQEFERVMRLHDDVLRYMSIRMEELEEGPSAQMQSRGGGRDAGRGGRGGPRGDRDRGPRGDRDRGDRGDRDRGDRGDRGDRSERPARTKEGERA